MSKGKFFVFIDIVKRTLAERKRNNLAMLSAALSFYALFSIGPLLLLIIFLSSLIVRSGGLENEIVDLLKTPIGESAADMLMRVLQSYSLARQSLVLNIIGLVILLIGATAIFGHLQLSFNIIWEAKPKKENVLTAIKKRFMAIALIVILSILLLGSFVAKTIIVGFSQYLSYLIPIPHFIISLTYTVLSFIVTLLFFAAIFRFLPSKRLSWKNVGIGSLITSILFFIGQTLLGIYLRIGSVGSAYGAAGSLVVFLVWIYYCGQIILFGAQFTKVYTDMLTARRKR